MKSDVRTSFVQLEPELLKDLVKQVDETVAKGIALPKQTKKSFGRIDLWNIRRNAKYAGGRFVR